MSRNVAFSTAALQDADEITRYTQARWGDEQAFRYVDDLRRACLQLAEFPHLGRSCTGFGKGLLRLEHGRHVIFYRADAERIVVSRFLHAASIPHAEDFTG